MMLIPFRRSRGAVRLLATLSAALLAWAAAAPASAAAPQAATEATVMSFALPARPSAMLRAPLSTWTPVLTQASAVLGEHLKAADLPGKPVQQIELQLQRAVLAQILRDWPTVLDAVKQARQLQQGESGRQTAGLLNEVLARQAIAGGDAAWLQRHLRDQVLAMPWTEVEPTIRTLRQQLAIMKGETVESFVASRLDISTSYTENKASLGFITQLLAMRFQLLEVMPRRDALVAGLDEAIAQRSSAAASAAGS